MALSPDPRQTDAIEHVSGPMLVLAGAGTGKTTVLTGRIARLIASGAARPDEILAITYTDNAAAEMQKKLSEKWGVAPDVAERVAIRTFHSYCFEVLNRAGRGFKLLDGNDLWIYLRRRIVELELKHFAVARAPGQFLKDLLNVFQCCYDELVTVDAFAAYAQRLSVDDALPLIKTAKKEENIPPATIIERCREIARVYGVVERMLEREGLGTFGHMIVRARALFDADRALLDAERRRARFILIDEFQDSNAAQIELAELLAGGARNVFAVGDPDQSIYQFRGATGEAFDYFLRRFPESRTVTLEENRRSTEPILACSATMIACNPEPAGARFRRRPLVSARARQAAAKGERFDQPPVELVITPKTDDPNLDLEALEIARVIREAHDRDGVPWSRFAVLYRQHQHRDQVVAEFFRQGIPYEVRGVNALDTPEVRDLMALLSVAAGDNGEALLRVAAMPHFVVDAAQCRDKLKAAGGSPDAAAALAKIPGGQQVLAEVKQVRREAAEAGMRLTSVLIQLLRRLPVERSSAPVRALLNFASAWEDKPIVQTRTVSEFLDYMRLFRECGGTVELEAGGSEEDRVKMMTVHVAKGLEFDRVFILRANSNSFPCQYHEPLFAFPQALRREGSLADGGSKELHLQEERRLFYVAMTRAEDSLTICAKPGRGRKEPRPDGFLRDLMDKGETKTCWRQRTATATIDVMAAAAALPEPVGIAAWLASPPREPLANVPLSASSVERYERCPLSFKIQREWNLPGAPAAQMQFGAAVHTALKGYYDAVLAGRPLSLEALLRCFEEALADMPAQDAYQRELYLKDGREQLTDFYRLATSRPHPQVVATEQPFRMKVGGALVVGRIDRMDRLDDRRVEIVDYKTGKPRDEEKAGDSLQLSIYALAAKKEFGREAGRVTFYNVATNEAVSTERSESDLVKTEKRIAAVAENIAAGNFEAKRGRHCAWCDYYELCPATEQRLYSIRGVGAGVN